MIVAIPNLVGFEIGLRKRGVKVGHIFAGNRHVSVCRQLLNRIAETEVYTKICRNKRNRGKTHISLNIRFFLCGGSFLNRLLASSTDELTATLPPSTTLSPKKKRRGSYAAWTHPRRTAFKYLFLLRTVFHSLFELRRNSFSSDKLQCV